MEVGSGLGHDARRTRPADVLVPNWVLGKPAAFKKPYQKLIKCFFWSSWQALKWAGPRPVV